LTEENTDLAIVDEDNLAALLATQQQATEEELSTVSSDSSFLPRIQLMTSRSKPCEAGKFPINHFSLVQGQQNTDLGETVDVLPLVYRPKALDTNETIIQSYTPASDQFQRIMAKAGEKDSGCMYGPEYLCWIPSQKVFATLFFSSATMRNEAPAMKSRQGKPCTLKPQHIDPPKSKFSWWSTQVLPCSTPFEMPTREALIEATTKYNALEDTQIEKVEEEAPGDDRR
jgi:hypothetical protein